MWKIIIWGCMFRNAEAIPSKHEAKAHSFLQETYREYLKSKKMERDGDRRRCAYLEGKDVSTLAP
jgi:hypothetical protein